MFDVYSRVLRGIVNQSCAGDHSSKCERVLFSCVLALLYQEDLIPGIVKYAFR